MSFSTLIRHMCIRKAGQGTIKKFRHIDFEVLQIIPDIHALASKANHLPYQEKEEKIIHFDTDRSVVEPHYSTYLLILFTWSASMVLQIVKMTYKNGTQTKDNVKLLADIHTPDQIKCQWSIHACHICLLQVW